MSNLTILGISGSLRKLSRNTGLLRTCQQELSPNFSMEIADLHGVPFYNEDAPTPNTQVEIIFEQMKKSSALVFAATEYNYSIAPALKNILDWASKYKDNALLSGKPVAIIGAGGKLGSARSQYHLRQVCQYLNLYPLYQPEIFVNAFGPDFDVNGNLLNQDVIKLVNLLMTRLVAKLS
jgi:chromate reductase